MDGAAAGEAHGSAAPVDPLRPREHVVRDALVVVLAFVSGSTDALGFVRLGNVFTSVMTGNLVLLGVAAGRQEAALALHTGDAFVGFVAGALLGARVAGRAVRGQPMWPRAVSRALALELVSFVFVAVWWEAVGGHPTTHTTYVLLAVNALALGVQSSAILRFGVSGLSSTYLTGTLTTFVATMATRSEPFPRRSLALLVAVVTGAALGAVLTVEVPRAAPLVPVVLLIAVLTGARRSPVPSAGAPS
jgi:uncharacterized membrane protein YoaK (UPF0700 family)